MSENSSINTLKSDHKNARKRTDRSSSLIKESLEKFGAARSIVIDEDNRILAGNGTIEGAKAAGIKNLRVIETDGQEIIAVKRTGLSEEEKVGLALADNRTSDLSDWDTEMLKQLSEEQDLNPWFNYDELHALLGDEEEINSVDSDVQSGALAERFGIPPFSVLNAREGRWQERKKAWLATGIESELGREGLTDTSASPMPYFNNGKTIADKGGSIFDPVLAELAYRWFCPEKGVVVDPFAGGAVRGIVASKLGFRYIGCDLRSEQVDANRKQAENLCSFVPNCFDYKLDDDLTPIEKHGGFLVKRDDLFSVGGVNGGKVRTCWNLAQNAKGLVTAGSRESPQVNIVAHIAKELGIPCRVHTPEGTLSEEVHAAKSIGAEVIQHKAGYNSVIIKRAKDDSLKTGFKEIPFGMECEEAIKATKYQVKNIPFETKRIVIPVGSGMSLSGLLHGLKEQGLSIPVLGVKVGADPVKRLNKYAPKNWQDMVVLVDSGIDYHQHAPKSKLGDLTLDPVYEAKCLQFLEEGDLLWVVGIRKTSIPIQSIAPEWHCTDSRNIDLVLKDQKADFIFSCPPYADLEVYSQDPKDLSVLPYSEFKKAYFEIIQKTCSLLNEDSFACFVVGEIRSKKGVYQNFVADTIQAFMEAGLDYYNEAILLTPLGSIPIRAGRPFISSRKLGKIHQNVLVFVKGDAKKATLKCGNCEFGELEKEEDFN